MREPVGTVRARPVPLLFVHGAWHGAWCWDERFLADFARDGFEVFALSLRGHGSSGNAKPLRSCSVDDYVSDVCAVADSLSRPPVVIGHSMGGFVVQKYLETRSAPAGVLLASIPPQGLGRALIRVARQRPGLAAKLLLTGNTFTLMATPARARRLLFSAFSRESDVQDYWQRLQPESLRALLIDMLFYDLPHPKAVSTPVLVLGAAHDAVIATDEVEATARAYRTKPVFFPGGHDMMLEPHSAEVAGHIKQWLCSLELQCNWA